METLLIKKLVINKVYLLDVSDSNFSLFCRSPSV